MISIIIDLSMIFMYEIGIGNIMINSRSKIRKMIAVIKNWFEKLNFIFELDWNPHSTLDFDILFWMCFCSSELVRIKSKIVTNNEIKILIGMLILVIEKFLCFIVSR